MNSNYGHFSINSNSQQNYSFFIISENLEKNSVKKEPILLEVCEDLEVISKVAADRFVKLTTKEDGSQELAIHPNFVSLYEDKATRIQIKSADGKIQTLFNEQLSIRKQTQAEMQEIANLVHSIAQQVLEKAQQSKKKSGAVSSELTTSSTSTSNVAKSSKKLKDRVKNQDAQDSRILRIFTDRAAAEEKLHEEKELKKDIEDIRLKDLVKHKIILKGREQTGESASDTQKEVKLVSLLMISSKKVDKQAIAG